MENETRNSHGPNKIAHLEMIQGTVDRMGGNLFYLRGWSITLLAGLFAISTSDLLKVAEWAPLLFFVLLILFWIYDAYFLSLERKFRGLYDKVRKLSEEEIDFAMNIGEFKTHADKTIFAAMFSPMLLGFYGVLGVAMLIIFALIK
ncbi:hypothetical protein EDM68_01585 [Candidatus Uhrbacteria bacterium]|nr:MAG: hypothetical protein EDM68_01585 [Candidatus Uhrbacteria bacterium]